MKIIMEKYRDDDQERHIEIVIHDYDTWNMFEDISTIVLPMLIKLHEVSCSYFMVDDIDVPDHLIDHSLREGSEEKEENERARYDYIMNEMIFAHRESQYHDKKDRQGIEKFYCDYNTETGNIFSDNMKVNHLDNKLLDNEGLKTYYKRIQNGFNMFGKYYQSLWD